MGRVEGQKQDTRSNAELLAVARRFSKREYESDVEIRAYWHAVAELHSRGTRDVYDAALTMARDAAPDRRALACLLIGQLNRDGGTMFGEREAALLSVLRTERLARVRADALTAVGHLRTGFGDENTERFRADPEIVRFVTDPDANVRGSLAFALAGTATPEGIAAQLALMHDPRSTRARDWSTTSVGWMTAVDAPHVRAALLLRAEDRDEIVRAEAMHGLARRRDARVVPLIIRELEGYDGQNAGLFIAVACEFLYGDETVERAVDEVLAALHAA